MRSLTLILSPAFEVSGANGVKAETKSFKYYRRFRKGISFIPKH